MKIASRGLTLGMLLLAKPAQHIGFNASLFESMVSTCKK
jgi:hypothetical protein